MNEHHNPLLDLNHPIVLSFHPKVTEWEAIGFTLKRPVWSNLLSDVVQRWRSRERIVKEPKFALERIVIVATTGFNPSRPAPLRYASVRRLLPKKWRETEEDTKKRQGEEHLCSLVGNVGSEKRSWQCHHKGSHARTDPDDDNAIWFYRNPILLGLSDTLKFGINTYKDMQISYMSVCVQLRLHPQSILPESDHESKRACPSRA